MRKEKNFEINGCKYNIRQLRSMTAVRVLAKLSKIIAPATKGLKVEKGNVSMAALANAFGGMDIGVILESLTQNIDSDETFKIIEQLLSCVRHLDSTSINEDGDTIEIKSKGGTLCDTKAINDHFDEYGLDTMFLVIKECLVLNFANFLQGKLLQKSE